MAALAENLRPHWNALIAGTGRPGRVRLANGDIEGARIAVGAMEESFKGLLEYLDKATAILENPSSPQVFHEVADSAVEHFREWEMIAASFVEQLDRLRPLLEGEDVSLAARVNVMARQIAERTRDARWNAMAIRAKYRAADDALPEMSVGELRKLMRSA